MNEAHGRAAKGDVVAHGEGNVPGYACKNPERLHPCVSGLSILKAIQIYIRRCMMI
jgi:hypothetical protein